MAQVRPQTRRQVTRRLLNNCKYALTPNCRFALTALNASPRQARPLRAVRDAFDIPNSPTT